MRGATAEPAARGRAVRRLDLRSLAAGTRILSARDPDLARIVRRHGPPPLWGRPPGFPTLVRIILEQQVSLASARAMYLRLSADLGGISPDTIAAAGMSGLRRLGVTRQKAAYCHGLAQRMRDGSLDLRAVSRADDPTARELLVAVPGVGPWSASIYLLMALRRPDVWPVGDLALAESLRRLRGLRERPSQERLTRIAAGWAPWRAVAARILWHHYLAA